MRLFQLLAVACLLFCCGCDREQTAPTLNDELILQLSELPRARQSPLVALREEIARLEQEAATPALLAEASAGEPDGAKFIVELFPGEDLAELDRESGEMLPLPSFRVGPIQLERLHRFRAKYDDPREQARRWASESTTGFRIDPRQGWFVDTSFISAAAVTVRLEMLYAVEQLAAGDLNGAADAWDAAMTLCERLAATPHVNARLAAVHLRADLLQLLAAIVQAPQASGELATRLATRLQAALDRWPAEARLWRMDRAVGMHAYELIRAGHLLHILTPDEVQQFAEEQILRELEGAAQRFTDADQLFYLNAMRSIVASCRAAPNAGEPPYYLRTAAIDDVLQALDAQRGDSDYPLIAARLLLPGVRPAQQLLALDRARCEAWLLALAQAGGGSPPAYELSPLNGKPYTMRTEAHRVVVSGFSDDPLGEPAAIVPRFDIRVSRLP